MVTRISAIFESGVFRPTHPVNFSDGEHVQIDVLTSDELQAAVPAASVLAQIAAMPLESDVDVTTARDHDHYLYGTRRQ